MGYHLLSGIVAGPGSFTGTSGRAGSGFSDCAAGLATPFAGIHEVPPADSEVTGTETVTRGATSGFGRLSST